MKHPLLLAAVGCVILLQVACTGQDPPEPYNENLPTASSELLLPTAPVDADARLMNPDAGPLPEPASAGPPAEPPRSGTGDQEND